MAQKRVREAKQRPKCLTCSDRAQVRGLCWRCYMMAYRAMKRGASEKDLIRKELILPANPGGRPPKDGWSDKFKRVASK